MAKGYLLIDDSGIPNSQVQLLGSATGIDGKTIGTTNLFTVPTGRTAILTGAYVVVTVADTITLVGSAGIGVAAGEDDVFGSVSLGSIDAVDKLYSFLNDSITSKVATSGQIVKFGIDTGFTATTATLSVFLVGFLY